MSLTPDRRGTRRGNAVVVEPLDGRQLLSASPVALSPALAEQAATPGVRIAAVDASTQEGGDRALVRLTRTGGDTAAALRVKLKWSGSAKKADLVKQPKYATFAAGATTVDVAVRAIEDRKAEATETAKITVQSGSGYTVATGGNAFASVLILDARTDLQWKQVASAPIGRVEPDNAVVDGKVYVFSGYANDKWQAVRRADVYDPATDTWTQLRDMPVGVTHAAVEVVGKKIWLAGGYEERVGTTGEQNIAVTTVVIYDTETDTYSYGPDLPAQRGSGGLALVDNKLYFYGGEQRDRTDMPNVWALDLADESAGWQARAPMPQGETHFGTAVVNGIIYTFGGWRGYDTNATFLKDAFAYDPKADAWHRLRDLPIAMSHLTPATVTQGGKIYMFGGEYQFNYETDQVLEYDPATDTYRKLSPLPVPRSAAVAAVVGNEFIFSSGKHDGWNIETYVGTWI